MPLFSYYKISKPKNKPISDEKLTKFLSFCKHHKFRKKGMVFKEGDPADSFYYIVKGSLSVSQEEDNKGHVILANLHQGEFIGELGIFIKDKTRCARVRAREDCLLAEMKYDDYERLVKNELKDVEASILYTLGFQLSDRLLKSSKRVHLLTSLDAAGRIARTLLDICQEPGALSHPDGTQIHISRQEISRIVNCSRETVGRVLKQMALDGMIEVSGMDIVVYHSR